MRLITKITTNKGEYLHSVDECSVLAARSTITWYDLDTNLTREEPLKDFKFKTEDYYGIYMCGGSYRFSCMTPAEYDFLRNLQLVYTSERIGDLDFSNQEVPVEHRGLLSDIYNKHHFIDESASRFPNLVRYMVTILRCPDFNGRYWKLKGDTLSVMNLNRTYIFKIKDMAKFGKALLMRGIL